MIRFGTGGWRGIIADDFTFENVRRVAKGLSMYAKEHVTDGKMQPIVVGYDMRFMSTEFARAFAEVLASEGINVLFMSEPAPTPMVMHEIGRASCRERVEISVEVVSVERCLVRMVKR